MRTNSCIFVAAGTVYACGCNEHGQCGVAPVDSSTKQTDKVYMMYVHVCVRAYTHNMLTLHTYPYNTHDTHMQMLIHNTLQVLMYFVPYSL